MLIRRRAQQQSRRVDGAGGGDEELAPDRPRGTVVTDLDAGDLPSRSIGEQRSTLVSRMRIHPAALQCGTDQPHLGIVLCAEFAGEAVAGGATNATPAVVPVDGDRQGKRPQALCPQLPGDGFDHRLMADRRMRHRTGTRRLDRIGTGKAMRSHQPLGDVVIRRQFGVADRPGRRHAVLVLQRLEILLAEPYRGGAEEFRIAADVI